MPHAESQGARIYYEEMGPDASQDASPGASQATPMTARGSMVTGANSSMTAASASTV